MPQVEGHGLRGGRKCRVATGLGPRLKPPPGGGVGPAGVVGLGVPEAGGDGLGRLAIALSQFQGDGDLLDDGQIGGHGRLGKTRDNTILSRVLLTATWEVPAHPG